MHKQGSQTTQKEFTFLASEVAVLERRGQLGRALRDISADANLCLLARLVFDQTASGVGTAWKPVDGEELILGHAWGPRCSRSKLYKVFTDAKRFGIIHIEPVYDEVGRRTGSAYSINWTGIYRIRGLALPEPLQSVSQSNQSVKTNVPNSTIESPIETGPSTGETAQSTAWTGQSTGETATHDISAHAPPGAPCHDMSVLSVLSVDVDKTFLDTQDGRKRFVEVCQEIDLGLCQPRQHPLDEETHDLIMCSALLSLTVFEVKWVRKAIQSTKRSSAQNRMGYFKRTLANLCSEYYGRCMEGESRAYFNSLLRQVRPIIAIFKGRHSLSE